MIADRSISRSRSCEKGRQETPWATAVEPRLGGEWRRSPRSRAGSPLPSLQGALREELLLETQVERVVRRFDDGLRALRRGLHLHVSGHGDRTHIVQVALLHPLHRLVAFAVELDAPRHEVV